MNEKQKKAGIFIISGFITILIVIAIFSIGMLFTSCTTDICKIKYNEPDETWDYAYFSLDNVVSCHSSNTKKGIIYWIVYDDVDCEWDNQIISMDKETFNIIELLIDLKKYDNTNILLDEYEFAILYKIHYQPVLILVDRD